MRLRPAFSIGLALPVLMLAACGDGEEENMPTGSAGATDNDEILEGTIDDSMIDLSGAETVIVTEKPAEPAAAADEAE